MSVATPAGSVVLPLEGVRVVDLTMNIAGPYATKLLADAGADVVKIEDGDGDPLRRWGPSASDGHDGALEFFGGINEKWDGLGVSVSEVLADGERVVVIGRASGTLRSSGEDLSYGFVHAWTMRNGRAVRFEEYVAPPAELLARV